MITLQSIPYLSLNGIPVTEVVNAHTIYFIRDLHGVWYPNRDNHLYDIDSVCVELSDAFAECLFGSKEDYYSFLWSSPQFLSTAGMNSESKMSKEDFGRLLQALPVGAPSYKALYLYDCRMLVTGIQECSKEVMQLQGEFYQVLNLEEFYSHAVPEEDGVRFVASPTVTKLHALLGFVYIRLHSLLDYVTKVAIEIKSLREDFSSYPKLASKNLLYGDRNRTSLDGTVDTLFEKCTLLTEIEVVRNHLIHQGLLDDMPKAYRVISNGACIEKFVLFPDRTNDGRFDTFKNRTLFYGQDDKINLRLPDVVSSFQGRLLNTLRLLKTSFTTE